MEGTSVYHCEIGDVSCSSNLSPKKQASSLRQRGQFSKGSNGLYFPPGRSHVRGLIYLTEAPFRHGVREWVWIVQDVALGSLRQLSSRSFAQYVQDLSLSLPPFLKKGRKELTG